MERASKMPKFDEGINVLLAAQRWKPSFTMELDKIPGAWVVTGWLDDEEVTLRLRIQHTSEEEPTDMFCEVRLGRGDEFQSL